MAGGLVAWIIHLGASYALVPLVCAAEAFWVLHLLTGMTALGAASSAGAAAWAWHRLEPDAFGARSFLASAGFLMGAFFVFLILFEGLPLLLQENPCEAVPTFDRPIIRPDGRRAPGPA